MATSANLSIGRKPHVDEGTVLVRQLASMAPDPTQLAAMSGLLRAVTRTLLDATVTRRQEAIEPYARTLAFAARRLVAEMGDEAVHGDPRYVLGRLDALLDLCDMGIDRGISEEVVAVARGRAHVRQILDHLVRAGETRASDLASAVCIKPNYLSNILRWMESVDLVRRVAPGRATLVSLGPKGEAVYRALIDGAEADRLAHEEQTPWLETDYAGEAHLPAGLDDDQVKPVAA